MIVASDPSLFVEGTDFEPPAHRFSINHISDTFYKKLNGKQSYFKNFIPEETSGFVGVVVVVGTPTSGIVGVEVLLGAPTGASLEEESDGDLLVGESATDDVGPLATPIHTNNKI